METASMGNSLKEFCYRGDKRNGQVAGGKHGIKGYYFHMRNTACLYTDGNKLIMKKREPLQNF